MKNIVMSIVVIVFLAFFTSCEEDPCENLTCNHHGYCDDGTCICDDGYYGVHCQNGGPEEEPKGYKVTRITISNFPQCWSNGTQIDGEIPGDYPDVLVKLQNGTTEYTTGVDFDASQVDFDNLNWIVTNTTYTSLIRILDQDQLGAVSVNEELKLIGFDFSDLLAENDGAFSTQIQDSFSSDCYPGNNPSWCRMYFEIL